MRKRTDWKMASLRVLAVTSLVKSIFHSKLTFSPRDSTFPLKVYHYLNARLHPGMNVLCSSLKIIYSQSSFLNICYPPVEHETFDDVNLLFKNVNIAYQKIISYSLVSFWICAPSKLYSDRNNLTLECPLASSMPSNIASSFLNLRISLPTQSPKYKPTDQALILWD